MIEVFPNIKALIFDCDGTLADSMPLHMLAWKMALEEVGESYREDFLDPLKGMNEEEIIKLYNAQFGRELNPTRIVDQKHQFFLKNIHQVKPIKEVTDLVHKYFGILPMAVVSGGRRNSVHKTLELLHLLDCFEVVFTADDPFPPKPAPDLFIAAARFLKVKPEFCQVFEDGDMGLIAAQQTGMKTTDVRLYIRDIQE